MTLRRTLWALPLTVSVAVLAHFAAFGFVHAPGAGHSATLFGALGVTLVLALLGTFTGGFLGRPAGSIATERRFAYAPLLLAAAGVATFGLIELSEGHSALGPLLQAALVSLPLAYLVALVAGVAGRAVHRAGVLCARYVTVDRRRSASITLTRGTRRLAYAPVFVRGTNRGRAPPRSI